MINIMISGALGAMGRVVYDSISQSEGVKAVCGFDVKKEDSKDFPIYDNLSDIKEDIDVVIDFSHYSVVPKICEFCKERNIALVCATTGLGEKEENAIKELSEKTAVFRTGNFSYGVSVLSKLTNLASKLLCEDFDVEIIEKHHNKKVDAPSGTANMLIQEVKEGSGKDYSVVYGRNGKDCKREKDELTVHSIRGGTIVGEHIVLYAGEDEVIEIKHTAYSKKIFAFGAVKAAKFIADKKNGLYDMKDM